MSFAERTPEQIRADIERTRQDLGTDVTQLRGAVGELTNWRGHLRRHRGKMIVGAVAVGFLVGAAVVRRRGGE